MTPRPLQNHSRPQTLAGFRREVAEAYAAVRRASGEAEQRAACAAFRQRRDRLFREHPHSALTEEQKGRFAGLRYFEYDPALRMIAPIRQDVPDDVLEVDLGEDGLLRMRPIGRIEVVLEGDDYPLTVYWLEGYGGGLFLPVGDATNGSETYGGGRYVLDTIKGADLGEENGGLVIDFNYAYNPSCAYNARWQCPLTPPGNRLPVPIRAGERLPQP